MSMQNTPMLCGDCLQLLVLIVLLLQHAPCFILVDDISC